jgi:hypothetical protein
MRQAATYPLRFSPPGLVSPGTRNRRRRSLIRCLVETVRETSTERIRLAHYHHQHSSFSATTTWIWSLEDKGRKEKTYQIRPNPVAKASTISSRQSPIDKTYRSIFRPTIIKRLSSTLHSHSPYSGSPALHRCSDGWWQPPRGRLGDFPRYMCPVSL